MEIGPGVWVEFTGPWNGPFDPEPGTVWRCEAIVPGAPAWRCHDCRAATHTDMLVIAGMATFSGNPIHWCPNHWRPIYRGDGTLIEKLKQGIDVGPKVCEPA